MSGLCACGIWPQGVAIGRVQAQGNKVNLQTKAENIAFSSWSALTGLARRMLWALTGIAGPSRRRGGCWP